MGDALYKERKCKETRINDYIPYSEDLSPARYKGRQRADEKVQRDIRQEFQEGDGTAEDVEMGKLRVSRIPLRRSWRLVGI